MKVLITHEDQTRKLAGAGYLQPFPRTRVSKMFTKRIPPHVHWPLPQLPNKNYLVQNQLQQTYLYIIQLATGPFANLSNHLQYPIRFPSPSNNQMKFQMALPSPAAAAPHFMAPHAPTCLGLPKPSAIAP